jgi:hypothetical protein
VGSNKEKRRGSLTTLPREGVSSNPTLRSKNGRRTSLLDKREREITATLFNSGRWPPWLAPMARRRATASPFSTTIRSAAGTNRSRRSTRTHLRWLGRQEQIEDGMRLGKAVAPLPAHRSSIVSRFKAPQTNRKAWGGREGDDELTNAEKKGTG